MKLIQYGEWSTLARGATTSSHPIGATDGITLHWEGPHMGSFSHDACADHIRGIQRFHRETRGWADIAYNAVVCPHGYVFEGRGPGVTSAANGNETDNDDWYAVCYLGGELDPFTDAAKTGFADAVRWLRDAGAAGPLVNGHRDHKATACPGDEIYAWLHAHDWNDLEDDMPYTEKQLTGMMRAAVAAELAPLNERLEQLDDEHKALIRKLFANLRVILKERFGATDADLDEILGELEP